MPDNSSTLSPYDDFLSVVDRLKKDFDRAYSDVSSNLEPLFFETLANHYGLSAKAVGAAWRGYCDRRRIGRPMLGPLLD